MIDYGKIKEEKIFDDTPITSEHVLDEQAYPIKIQIINNSDKTIIVSPQSFNISSVDYSKLAKDVHYHEIIRPILTHFGGTFLIGFCFGILSLARIINPYDAVIATRVISLASFIGNIKHWWDLRSINKKIDTNICDLMCLNRSFAIPPQGQLNKLVFLRKYELISAPQLSINVYEQSNNSVYATFNVHIG